MNSLETICFKRMYLKILLPVMNPDPCGMALSYFLTLLCIFICFLVTNKFGGTEEIFKSSQILFSYLIVKCGIKVQVFKMSKCLLLYRILPL